MCSNRTGHVIYLHLYYSSFEGKIISSALIELRHLHYLNFGSNHLRVDNLEWLSHLPLLRLLDLSGVNLNETNNWLQQISKLSFLEELDLYDCQLPRIPLTIDTFVNSSLHSLSVLDLAHNDLTSFSIFHWFLNMSTRITHIYLNHNRLEGPIPSTFGRLVSLEELYLTDNMLQSIPKSLGNLSHLRVLDVSHNALNGLLPDTFGGLISLEELNLRHNKLQRFPKSMGNLSHLRVLDMSYNALNEPLPHLFQILSGVASKSLEYIALSNNQLFDSLPDITWFSSLKDLQLSNNKLNGFSPQSPGRPSNLQYLDLSGNKIGGSLSDLRVYSALEELHLSDNQLKMPPKGIWQLMKLKYLDLSSNSIKGTITKDHFSSLANLMHLDLSYNSLSLNMSTDWIPPFRLSYLSLGNCNVGPHFPKWIQTQRFLSILDMSSSSISNTLPTWLWNIPTIVFLNLSYNNINGRLPCLSVDAFGPLQIDLSNNKFSGPIPLFLFYSSKLVQLSKNQFSGTILHLCTISNKLLYLDLSDNQLTGELPDCWKKESDLQILNLANNNFSRKIPSIFGDMPLLQTLQLRNNNFIGELPISLKNCTELNMLDVEGNKLTGTIPEWIGTHLTRLRVLSLRFNKFYGNIDPIICHLTHIEILDLSRNNISGKIPDCFYNFTLLAQQNNSIKKIISRTIASYVDYDYMGNYEENVLVQWKGKEEEYRKFGILKGIDLSSNKLVGTIPLQFCNMRGLIFLNLSRNHLTGNIIPRIDEMEMLEWLDLSRNKFFGEIPNGLAQLHFLSVLDLSYNNLTGRIPLGTQLQSFDSSAYAGNSQLCGLPLAECPNYSHPSSIDNGRGNDFEDDDEFITQEFYFYMVFGFITGFWVVLGTLILKRSWRHSYFNFWNNIGDWIYVTTMIYVTRFKRKFIA